MSAASVEEKHDNEFFQMDHGLQRSKLTFYVICTKCIISFYWFSLTHFILYKYYTNDIIRRIQYLKDWIGRTKLLDIHSQLLVCNHRQQTLMTLFFLSDPQTCTVIKTTKLTSPERRKHYTPKEMLRICPDTQHRHMTLSLQFAVKFLNTTYHNIMMLILHYGCIMCGPLLCHSSQQKEN